MAVLIWLYVLGVLAWWVVLRFGSDRVWPATILLFAPRWPMLLPLLILLPLAIAWRRVLVLVLIGIAILIAWPIMGFCTGVLPTRPADSRADLRILTLNSHFAGLNAEALHAVIERERPDVIVLQEWWIHNLHPMLGDDRRYPYQVNNDLALLASRYPVRPMLALKAVPTAEDGIFYGYTVDLPGRSIQFFNVHLASPHNSLREIIQGGNFGINRLRQNAMARWNEAMRLRDLAKLAGSDVILAGDFNLPPDSPIFRSAFGDLSDAFSTAGFGYGWTYYHHTAVRIDHIVTGDGWQCERCWVGPDVGSPHRPLLVDLKRISTFSGAAEGPR
ncbi:MAG: endonuclease/exonuclease/phosphatase family protein [Phycisphaerae bacterium]|nr:endonuclease/exonuclease/phosphatase family protein [Phycisphaerae bacterium]